MSEDTIFPLSFLPAGVESGVLERTLVGRRALVDKLEQLVIESATTGNKHQRLIIGPRGSGKTHTLRVLFDRISKKEVLKKKLRIAYLVEEEYGVASFLDFIIRVLLSFTRWDAPGANYLNDEIEKLKKTAPGEREKVAVNILLEYIKGKTLLIIVENIETIFDKKLGFGFTGQRKLRDLLQQHPYFTIMASNQSLFLDVQREDRPFHNFFKIEYLKRLTLDETFTFLNVIAKEDGNKGLMEFLDSPEGKGRIRAVFELIGGNHRLLVTFCGFLKTDYVSKLSGPFMKTVNALIPFYQGMMSVLTSQQQKIIQFMCKLRRAATGKEVAENCFIDINTLSKQMSTLVRLKYVDSHPRGRVTFYELAEPLLRICFEVKENKGSPVKIFVDFIGNIYTAEEIKRKFMRYHVLSKTSKNSDSPDCQNEAEFYKAALISYFPDIIAAANINEFEKKDKDSQIKDYINELEESSSYTEILEFISNLERKDHYLMLKESKAYGLTGDPDKQIEVAEQILKNNKNDIDALLLLAGSFFAKLNLEKAKHYTEKALTIDKNNYQANNLALNITLLEFDNRKAPSLGFSTYVAFVLLRSPKDDIKFFFMNVLPSFYEKFDNNETTQNFLFAAWTTLRLSKDMEMDAERFDFINTALTDAFCASEDTKLISTIFDIGYRYLKKGEKNALFSLPKEAREFFQKEVLDYIE